MLTTKNHVRVCKVSYYKDILVRRQGLGATSTAVLILIGYALLLLALAVWRFQVD